MLDERVVGRFRKANMTDAAVAELGLYAAFDLVDRADNLCVGIRVISRAAALRSPHACSFRTAS